MTMFSLRGRMALVTGGGQGLGLEIARGLAWAGAHVVLNGRNRDRLETASAGIIEQGGAASISAFDVTNEAAVADAMAAIATQFGRLDILVNNAATRHRKPFEEITSVAMRDLLEAGLIGPAIVTRLALPLLRKSKAGRIINITSIAGHVARSGDAAYTAAKAGLTGLTRALAAEYGPDGITVNAIAPGFFATAANAAMVDDPAITERLRQRTSLGRWGKADEIAGAAVFLASDQASYVTGHVLAVDGGYLSHF